MIKVIHLKLDFDKFHLDGLSTIRTLKKNYYNELYTTELKVANTYTFVYFTLHFFFEHNFTNIYSQSH